MDSILVAVFHQLSQRNVPEATYVCNINQGPGKVRQRAPNNNNLKKKKATYHVHVVFS